MTYRVSMKISYLKTVFDFEDLVMAGNFAQIAAKSHVPGEDGKLSIRIELIEKEERGE